MMKPEAIIVNTSRGPVIDEKALVLALQQNIIGGAGLDVFDKEPLSKDSPLLQLDNVVMTPHSAALTNECVIRMATDAAARVIEVLSGKRPLNIANPKVLAAGRWAHLTD